MNFKTWMQKFSIKQKDLYYKLTIAFGFFFIVPVAGFLYFAFKYDIVNDQYLPFFFLLLLIFFFVGYRLLRKLIDSIIKISASISRVVEEEIVKKPLVAATDELTNIVQSFKFIEGELKNNLANLQKRNEEFATLKELSDLCHMTFDSEDLLYITLERALKIVDADIGSVMVLRKPKRDAFVIEANIGLDDFGKKGTVVPFEESIAKFAVINKSPLLVEDIEKDIRFRQSVRSQYSTKSFICMPLKTSSDLVGVITISRKTSDKIFTQNDVDVLTPLLSNAAFTFDNLNLLKQLEDLKRRVLLLRKISISINSSLKEEEVLQAIMQEMKKTIPCDMIMILKINTDNPRNVTVVDFHASLPSEVTRRSSCPYEGTVLDKVIKQQQPVFIDDVYTLNTKAEISLFQHEQARSCLILPLKTEGNVTGMLLIFNIPEYKLEELNDTIETIADHLSQAMEKGRMKSSVTKRDRELESLQLIGSALSSSTFNMEKMLKYTMDMIQGAISVEAGYLLLSEGNKLKFAAAFNLDMQMLEKMSLLRGEGIAGYVADCGVAVMTNNAQDHPRFSYIIDNKAGIRTESVLTVPVISQGRVTGVIEIINKKDGYFNEEDKQLLKSIASSVSIALENARLYKESIEIAEKERGVRKLFQKFVPHQVIDKIASVDETGKEKLLEEAKTLTLLNIDIRDFSPLSKKIGPKKTVDMLNYFFSVMGEIVFKNQGIVDKYLGDGFLAVFGAPVSSRLDEQNAITAALEMQSMMDEVNKYCRNKFGEEFFMGLVIHTGEAVVGNIGFEKKMDYTVIGTAVNFVFKLQALCRQWPNNILVSETTFSAVRNYLNDAKVKISEIENSFETTKVYRIETLGKSKNIRTHLK